MTYRFLNGPQIDQVLTQEGTSTTHWLLADHLGTTREVLDNSGNLVRHYVFDAYGNLEGTIAHTRLLFAGRELDSITGLYYVRARWYDPAVGRWVSEDPIGFAGGDTNLARYVGNSPVNYTDPSGLDWVDVPIIGNIVVYHRGRLLDRERRELDLDLAANHPWFAAEEFKKLQLRGDDSARSLSTVCARAGVEITAAGCSGLFLTRHALTRMAERGVSSLSVTEAFKNGTRSAGNTPGTSVYTLPAAASSSGRGVVIVVDDKTGNVITVIDKGSKFK